MPSNEKVVGIMEAGESKMFGLSATTYTLVITHQRMIIAKWPDKLFADAQRKVGDNVYKEKGFFANAVAQINLPGQFMERYYSMTPDEIISETPGNRAIDNVQISAIKLKGGQGLIQLPNNVREGQFKMIIESTQGKIELTIPEKKHLTSMLKDVYGDKLHMPFGYIAPISININPF